MGQIIRAPWGSGIDSIDHDHEHLHILIDLAERSAVNGDRRHCGEMLKRAAAFLEAHAGREEDLLMRCGYDRVLEIRRGHERLIVSLEQALAGIETAERAALVDEIRRIMEYLSDSVSREAQSLRRFFAQPGVRPRAAAIAAVRS